jgi:FkbM family methyltransferase
MFDILLEQLKNTKFYNCHGGIGKGNVRSKIHPLNSQILHFCTKDQMYYQQGKVAHTISRGVRNAPEVYQTLKEIAKIHFPSHEYNWIQVNKNVKTEPHKDKMNKGNSYTYAVGDFEGGALMTENGEFDIHNKPLEFNGCNTTHWTGEWTGGDRYCIIYFYNKKKTPEKIKGALEKLNPESHTDYLTINEIFRTDIYKMDKLVGEGEVWLDIGANIGAFTMKCLDLGVKRVHSYEPNKRNFDKLTENFVNDDRVVLNHTAVSDYDGTANLYLEKNGDWRHTIRKPIKGRETESVSVCDAIRLPACDGIKMDCEGSEIPITKRLDKFPAKLVMEYDGSYNNKKVDYDAFIDFLKTKYENVECQELKTDIKFFPNGLGIRCWGLKV